MIECSSGFSFVVVLLSKVWVIFVSQDSASPHQNPSKTRVVLVLSTFQEKILTSWVIKKRIHQGLQAKEEIKSLIRTRDEDEERTTILKQREANKRIYDDCNAAKAISHYLDWDIMDTDLERGRLLRTNSPSLR